ncbi:hypothetical protein BB560_004002, partial [Smittium megazygosporum]
MNFLHNFNFRGPKTPFYRRSRHDQSQAAKYFFEVADRISNDDANSLFNYIFFRSHRGGSLLSEVIRDYTG